MSKVSDQMHMKVGEIVHRLKGECYPQKGTYRLVLHQIQDSAMVASMQLTPDKDRITPQRTHLVNSKESK